MGDELVRGWVGDGGARALVAECSELLRETGARHTLNRDAMELTGDLIVANVLLGAWIKGAERLSLQLQTAGSQASFFGEIDAEGQFRARVRCAPRVTATVDGMMLAIKYDDRAELYRGVTALEADTVEAALQRHLVQSDQVMAVVRIHAGADGRAVGLMVERMPYEAGRPSLEDDAWEALRSFIASAAADDVAALIDGVRAGALGAHEVDILDARDLVWRCRCSDAGVRQMLTGLGAPALREMADEDHGAEVTCHFCMQARQFSEEELREMAARVEAEGVAQA
jgi:molecular chaperone Hsp33